MGITATVNYHVHRTAPQAFEFDVDGIAGNLISPELVNSQVFVKDLRDGQCSVAFEQDGISFVHAPSIESEFASNNSWQSAYDNQISALLTEQIGAKDVLVFDHTVRIDDGKATRKPARNVHNDYSPLGANQRLIDLLGKEKAQEYQRGHYAFVNVWRPVEYVIASSPLGFIRPSTMDPEDWMTIELIYPDRKGQILGVAENPAHEWFYLSSMTPDEVAIFNIFDNQGRSHLAHSALDVVGQLESPHPRKSIETRTLVRYD